MKRAMFLWCLLFFGCEKLTFNGSTFYTVKGRIIDSTNNGIPNFGVSILNIGPQNSFGPQGWAISANTTTDLNGNFQIIFPSSNGNYYVQLQNGYVVFDTSGIWSPYNQTNDVGVDASSFQNYLYLMPPITVIKQ